jgi:DNA-directed RNA polymerase specialized sigma24 family protein
MQHDVDRMEARLREWAHWLTLGGTGDGFAAVNVLHPSWSPPTPGTLPTMKVGRSDRRNKDTHAAVVQLSKRLQATLQVHYCRRLAITEQALQLECSSSTVHARVRDAKRRLGLMLADRR